MATKKFQDKETAVPEITGYLANAEQYLGAAITTPAEFALPRFTSAYEGMYACVQAVLELHGVRTLEAGRQLAIQRVGADIGLSVDEGIALSRLHARRNGSTYQSTIPPVSAREAKAAVELLMKVLEKTKAHIAQITAQRGS